MRGRNAGPCRSYDRCRLLGVRSGGKELVQSLAQRVHPLDCHDTDTPCEALSAERKRALERASIIQIIFLSCKRGPCHKTPGFGRSGLSVRLSELKNHLHEKPPKTLFDNHSVFNRGIYLYRIVNVYGPF